PLTPLYRAIMEGISMNLLILRTRILTLGLFLFSSNLTTMTLAAQDDSGVPKRVIDPVVLHTFPLWETNVPGSKGNDTEDNPTLALFPAPKEKGNGTAVIVCPGGGYWVRAMDH